MKLVTYWTDAGPRVGRVFDEAIYDLTGPLSKQGYTVRDVGELLRSDWTYDDAKFPDGERVGTVDDIQLLPPVLWPRKILCVAANYKEHIEETKIIDYLPRHEASPWLFEKPPTSLNGHKGEIRLPSSLGTKIDWEAELGVVIGKSCHNIEEREVWDYIFGYTIVNDVSAREVVIPHRTKVRDRDYFHDWLHGKWFDTFCCVGPWVVTSDEIPRPQELRLGCDVSGIRFQDSDTAHMIFSIAELVSFASKFVTLEPGDIIATGTPGGVGKATGRFLREGDVVETWVEGIGTLINPVTSAR